MVGFPNALKSLTIKRIYSPTKIIDSQRDNGFVYIKATCSVIREETNFRGNRTIKYQYNLGREPGDVILNDKLRELNMSYHNVHQILPFIATVPPNLKIKLLADEYNTLSLPYPYPAFERVIAEFKAKFSNVIVVIENHMLPGKLDRLL